MKIRSALITVAIASFPVMASALPFIDGDLSYSGDSGSYVPIGAATLDAATGLDFQSGVEVDGSNGDFSGLTAGTIGLIDDLINIDSFVGGVTGWSIGAFTFVIDTLTIDFENSTSLLLSGTGTVSHLNYEDTLASWNLTANRNGEEYSWSGGIAAPPDGVQVPEPATLSLLGAGLLGMGLARRRRRSAS